MLHSCVGLDATCQVRLSRKAFLKKNSVSSDIGPGGIHLLFFNLLEFHLFSFYANFTAGKMLHTQGALAHGSPTRLRARRPRVCVQTPSISISVLHQNREWTQLSLSQNARCSSLQRLDGEKEKEKEGFNASDIRGARQNVGMWRAG